jgi:hypothetical protein
LSPYQLCIYSNTIPITGLYIFFTLPFENSANTYLKNPQSYSYPPQTGSKVVTYSPQIKTKGHVVPGAVLYLVSPSGDRRNAAEAILGVATWALFPDNFLSVFYPPICQIADDGL